MAWRDVRPDGARSPMLQRSSIGPAQARLRQRRSRNALHLSSCCISGEWMRKGVGPSSYILAPFETRIRGSWVS